MDKKSKARIAVFSILLAIALIMISVKADLNCAFTSGNCSSGTAVLYAKSDSGGFNNAHAERVVQSDLSMGSATASSQYNSNNSATKAIDGNTTIFGWGNNNAMPSWLELDFGTGYNMTVVEYRIICSSSQDGGWNSEDYNPKSWLFEGYNGTNWTVLDNITNGNITMNAWKNFSIPNTNPYRKYRLNISSAENGNWTHITELQLLYKNPNQYPNSLCCQSTGNAITTDCGTTFLRLWQESNSHVQDPNNSTGYNLTACMNSTRAITCQAETTCSGGRQCVLSMASDGPSNLTNAHIGDCNEYAMRLCCRLNSLPTVASATIDPTVAYTNTTLTCINGTVSDPDNDTVTLTYDWFNGTDWIGSNTQTLSQYSVFFNQTWNCSITPNDGSDDGATVYSDSVTIQNTIPTTPTLLTPTNNNATQFWRNVTFTWNSSYDPDVDEGTQTMSYELNITSATCPNHYYSSISGSTFTLPIDLECVNVWYNWTVRAYDGYNHSNWSQNFTFLIEPTIIINITQNETNYGSMTGGQEANTSNGTYPPFVIQNDGNVNFDTRIYAQDVLWDSVSLNTSYFQTKARNSTELGSFDQQSSRTKLQFDNITGITADDYIYVIGNLSYVDSHDSARIDTRIKAPNQEPPGAKSSNLMIVGDPWVG